MGWTLRRVVSSLLTCALVLSLIGPASAALTDPQRARRAVGFIAPHQDKDGAFVVFSSIGSTADAVLAFVAAGVGARETRRALNYLEGQVVAGNVDTEGQQAKVVLAWTAAGRGARTLGDRNLVKELRNGYLDGLEHDVYDTALAVLAIHAAGAVVPSSAIDFLLSQQCGDGGWDFDSTDVDEGPHCVSDPTTDFFPSDTNTTALVVMALQAAPTVAGAPVPPGPFDFFDAIRDEKRGGWGYTWGFRKTDANSTGLVLQAYAAEGFTAPAGSRKALRQLQYGECGAFAFTFEGDAKGGPDLGATIGAVPGLLGRAFPYTGAVDVPAPDTPACA
jgi:hypothetical protein